MENFDNIIYGIISIFIAIGIVVLVRTIIKVKLGKIHGTQKLLGLIMIIVIGMESAYLGLQFDLFTMAASIIPYARFRKIKDFVKQVYDFEHKINSS